MKILKAFNLLQIVSMHGFRSLGLFSLSVPSEVHGENGGRSIKLVLPGALLANQAERLLPKCLLTLRNQLRTLASMPADALAEWKLMEICTRDMLLLRVPATLHDAIGKGTMQVPYLILA